MTLTTDSATRTHRTSAASKPHSHKAAAAPPAPPFEPTDSVQIATPQQAAKAVASTPVLDPALQCALLTGLMQAAGSVQGNAIPLVTIDAALKGMGKTRYTMDLKGDAPLTSSGTPEKITSSKGQATLTNGPDTELRLGLDAKNKTLQVDGKLDGYATHLKVVMNDPTDQDDDVQGFHTEGTIGGQKYLMDSNFHIDPSTRPPAPPPEKKSKHKKDDETADDAAPAGPPPPPEKGTLDATGQVGSSAIKKQYQFAEQQQPFGATMDFNGQGSNVHLMLIA